ncbi:MAG: hypothetical protein ABJN14_19570 [Paracoccaceae bacterium]
MNTARVANRSEEASFNAPYRVIKANGFGPVLGYHVAGCKAGPNLLVTAAEPDADEVFRRLLSIPTLPWLRGHLFLLHLDKTGGSVTEQMPEMMDEYLENIDGRLCLTDLQNAQAGYWTILRFCTQYGMISGRGVPAPALVKADAV